MPLYTVKTQYENHTWILISNEPISGTLYLTWICTCTLEWQEIQNENN